MTSTLTKVSRVQNGSPAPLPSTEADSFKTLVESLRGVLNSDPGRSATRIINENNTLGELLTSKDAEIINLKQQMKTQEKDNDVAIKKFAASLGRETSKQKEAEARNESLQKTLTEKDLKLKEAKEGTRALNNLIGALQDKNRAAEASLQTSRGDVDTLMEKLKKQSNEIDSLKATKLSQDNAISSEKQKVADLENQLKAASKSLQSVESELSTIKGFCVQRDIDKETIGEEYYKLWKFATNELSNVLSQNIQPETLQSEEKWSKLREQARNLAAPYSIVIPASNSPAAKGMRVVVVLATLSRKINQAIFQPNYLTPDSNHLRETFNRLAETDLARESHCRSVMLAIDPEVQKANLKLRMQSVLQEVSIGLYPLLSTDQYEAFRDRVQSVVTMAARLWRDIKSSPLKFETEFAPNEEEWWSFKFPGFEDEIDERILNSHSLTVYPQLSLVAGEGRSCVENVVRLPQSHKFCGLAADEMVQNPSSPTISCMPAPKKARRPSVSGNGTAMNGKRTPDGKVNGAR